MEGFRHYIVFSGQIFEKLLQVQKYRQRKKILFSIFFSQDHKLSHISAWYEHVNLMVEIIYYFPIFLYNEDQKGFGDYAFIRPFIYSTEVN